MSKFTVVLIKPTHYDNDGYPIQWFRTLMPSNTLAAINGLLLDCARRKVLGPDVDVEVLQLDETNTRVRPERIIRQIKAGGGRALIAFVGVQSNQFPRTMDLAKPFVDAGLPTAIGGFHVSGCLAMLPELPPEIQAAKDMGVTLFAGETENRRFDALLRAAHAGTMKPVYNYMDDLPALQGEPYPFLSKQEIGKIQGDYTSFDLGRGCPYQCSFCTIINVQGRKSRFRDPDDLEKVVRANAAQGINKFFVTDDDLARNRHWEAHFDRLIELREKGFPVRLTIQVDMLCHKIPGFIEKACKAGAERVFFGLENINPDNLLAANKRQNKITEYRTMLQEWRARGGCVIMAGYILGFANDTPDTIVHDVEIVKRELPIDILEFFYLTPLPGSADHKALLERGTWMEPDLNSYDLIHRCTHHATMSDTEWETAYHQAWLTFFTPDHIETICRRSAAQDRKGVNINEVFEFFLAYRLEGVHPLESGILRRKFRADRRPGLPVENPLVFYPRYAMETIYKMSQYGWAYLKAYRMQKRMFADPDRHAYTDLATTPPEASDYENLALFQETAGAKEALHRQEVIDRSREALQAATN